MVSQDYLEIRQLKVASGVMFSDKDIAAPRCVIGKTIADNLFTNGEDPIGAIRFRKIPMRHWSVGGEGYNTWEWIRMRSCLRPTPR